MKKIIQIAATTKAIYALTQDGKVYVRLSEHKSPNQRDFWAEILEETTVRVDA